MDTDKFTGNSPGLHFPVDALRNYVVGGIKTGMLFVLQNGRLMTKQWLLERLDQLFLQ